MSVHIHAYYCVHEWPEVFATDPVAIKWLTYFATRTSPDARQVDTSGIEA